MSASFLIAPALFGFLFSEPNPSINASPPAVKARPNIILIVTDDQGYGDLSCHGNPILKTPNLDKLHDQSVRFTDFHVSPTCSPTRSVLMTGRHEFRNGVTHTIRERERLTLSAVTLAQILKRGGYSTGVFGKWHLGDEPAYRPNQRGFDEFFIHGGGGIGQTYPGSCGDAPGNTYFNPAILHNQKFEKTTGFCTDVFFAQAIQWIDAVRPKTSKGKAISDKPSANDQPFFCYLATNAPHDPYTAKPEDAARYKSLAKDEKLAHFFGMIHNIDENIGKLMTKLNEWGIERDTLVIFMNDNGTAAGFPVFNAGMRGHKGSAWLGGTRATSFWCWPGQFKPADCQRLTAHLDVLPTLAELADVALNDRELRQIEGRSLVPLLTDPTAPWQERILFTHFGRWPKGQMSNYKYKMCSARSTRWHLVSPDGDAKPKWQLFDVGVDPGEKNNLINEHGDVAQTLSKEFERWWSEIEPMQVNEDAVAPKINPFKELYWQQFGGGPTPELLKRMDPSQPDSPPAKKKKAA